MYVIMVMMEVELTDAELEEKRFWAQFEPERRHRQAEQTALWHQMHPDRARALKRSYTQKIKLEVLAHYGNGKLACVKCGFTDIRALSIDHVNGNGAQERKGLGKSGTAFYSHLKTQGYSEGYQTLCMNCQWIKRFENKEHRKN